MHPSFKDRIFAVYGEGAVCMENELSNSSSEDAQSSAMLRDGFIGQACSVLDFGPERLADGIYLSPGKSVLEMFAFELE